ncbi:Flp family type IVb pilin [Nocardioides jiangxiensis]|uniref:Flp family type IVb pilin n=1 Tax=Nocardioides jiangxiensis TaxID=3064524 RepID=A0ABT9B363_9ACTN|nr:Flp family type IVb pilin [Nocardioides sp. WY-20]MDO7869284.1 Flp family type IVb pilin [Nocardioides sp. WY-20]
MEARGIREECGASSVEYGLLVALIAAVIIGTVIVLGSTTGGLFSAICADPSPLC